ncbi:MAG: ribonuclease HIII [Gammaproteobacteria bacterium]|nr:ribonuclease HIII [Gammaproteobacteria bacterium]
MPTIKMNEQQIKSFINIYQAFLTVPPNEYIAYFLQGKGFSVSIYKSGKVVFQGSNLSYFSDYLKENKENPEYPYDYMNTIGSDEVGTGDLFGPIVVATALVKGKDTDKLKALGVKDSKKITDKEIISIGKKLIKMLKYKVIIVKDEVFNKNSLKYNLNEMKALLHNQNILELTKEVQYDLVCLDAFCSKQNYYKYLKNVEAFEDVSFEMKGETKSIAVAAASIIARMYFLLEMDNLSKLYGYDFPKGAGVQADAVLKKIIDDDRRDILKYVAKMNYKNFQKL